MVLVYFCSFLASVAGSILLTSLGSLSRAYFNVGVSPLLFFFLNKKVPELRVGPSS